MLVGLNQNFERSPYGRFIPNQSQVIQVYQGQSKFVGWVELPAWLYKVEFIFEPEEDYHALDFQLAYREENPVGDYNIFVFADGDRYKYTEYIPGAGLWDIYVKNWGDNANVKITIKTYTEAEIDVTERVDDLPNIILDDITTQIDQIADNVTNIQIDISGAIENTLTAVTDTYNGIVDTAISSVNTRINDIAAGLSDTENMITDSINTVYNSIVNSVSSMSSSIENSISSGINSAKSSFNSVGSLISDALDGGFESIAKLADLSLDKISNIWTDLIDYALSGVSRMIVKLLVDEDAEDEDFKI